MNETRLRLIFNLKIASRCLFCLCSVVFARDIRALVYYYYAVQIILELILSKVSNKVGMEWTKFWAGCQASFIPFHHSLVLVSRVIKKGYQVWMCILQEKEKASKKVAKTNQNVSLIASSTTCKCRESKLELNFLIVDHLIITEIAYDALFRVVRCVYVVGYCVCFS